MTETDIRNLILDWFNVQPRTRLYRRNVAGAQRLRSGNYVYLGKKGMADLWGVSNGRHLEIEVKKPGEKPTSEQYAWLMEQIELGAIAFVADSLDSAISQFKNWRTE